MQKIYLRFLRILFAQKFVYSWPYKMTNGNTVSI